MIERCRRLPTTVLIPLLAVCCLSLPRTASAQEPGYRQGDTSLGVGLAASSDSFDLLASAGYFVHPRLELGLLGRASFASQGRDVGMLSPYLQAYLLTRPPVTPFVRLSAGRLFIEDQQDGWVLHGGVGAALLLGSRLRLTFEVYRERYYLPPGDPEDIDDYHLGLGVVF